MPLALYEQSSLTEHMYFEKKPMKELNERQKQLVIGLLQQKDMIRKYEQENLKSKSMCAFGRPMKGLNRNKE